ncbi:MAG: hypothetical protein O2974_01745 [Chloroflexi bacterium]|nr:hypothetical protein [Chloroflexota bacterium]
MKTEDRKSKSSNPAQDAIETFTRWAQSFNDRDADAMIAEMHFPYMRLAGTEFQMWPTSEDFRAPQDDMTKALISEGWHTTVTKSVTAAQAGPEKVHLVIRQSRQRKDGSEYNGFDTLWIFTNIDGRWGVQFRSSFLANATQAYGASKPTF